MLYDKPSSRVLTTSGTSKPFRIRVGVYQRSTLSPLLFILVMDAITRDLQSPVPWTLLYADDVMLASADRTDLERKVSAWSKRLARFGLRLNVRKTEYLTTDSKEDGSIRVEGVVLQRTEAYKFLGSRIAADGNIGHEVTAVLTQPR